MSSPATADLSATSPSALLGDPSAAQPPQIGVGSRGKGAGRSLGRLKSIGGDLSKRGPRAPLSPQQREEGRQRLQVVRAQPQAAPRPAPRDDRERTAAGAPIRNPREIPKTGKAEAERDAIRHGMSKDTRRFHEGLSARAQDQFNKLTRAHQDITRRELDDEIVTALRAHREHALSEARNRRRPLTQADRENAAKRKAEVADIMRSLRSEETNEQS